MAIDLNNPLVMERILRQSQEFNESDFGKLVYEYFEQLHTETLSKTQGVITPDTIYERNYYQGATDAYAQIIQPGLGLMDKIITQTIAARAMASAKVSTPLGAADQGENPRK